MCRIVAYLGQEALLSDVLVRPENSLVMQSLHAREAAEVPTNGDGFGIGWYVPSLAPSPALFTSVFPAWSDQNLRHLTEKTQSPCFFGHVRAASVGGINTYNCHPFIHKNWMFMHNGELGDFALIKRHLRRMLDDDYYQWIKGETDSEHFFALFLQLARDKSLKTDEAVIEVLLETMGTVNQLIHLYGSGGASYLNLCLTDGERLFATRYCSDVAQTPSSLHYVECQGALMAPDNARPSKKGKPGCVLVASEQFTRFKTGWKTVLPNQLVVVNQQRQVTTHEIRF